MSSTFDTMQQALRWLDSRCDPDSIQAADVIYYFSCLIQELHDENHAQQDKLNRIGGRWADLLRTAMRWEDDRCREIWLRVQGEAHE